MGVPAAAQTTSCVSNASSAKHRNSFECPKGGLRPLRNRSRREPRRRWLSAHGRLLSSRVSLRPVDPNRRRAQRPVPPTSQPIAAAASCAVRIPSGNARTSTFVRDSPPPRPVVPSSSCATSTRNPSRFVLPNFPFACSYYEPGSMRIATTTSRQAQSTHRPATYIPGAKSHSPASLSDSGRSGFGPIGLFAQPHPRSHQWRDDRATSFSL